MQRFFPTLMAAVLVASAAIAQTPINAYARVTNVAGTTLSLSNVNESFDTYEDGERVMIIQIQDDVIGSNTGNNSSFGNLGAIQSAGLYEIATIASHTESLGLPNSITLSAPLSNAYNTGANSRLQIVSFPKLGSPNYTTTNDIGAVAWDGNIGGVIAFEVSGILTLNHNITANNVGFRGGNRSNNFYDGSTNCIATPFISNSANQAFKGEGIYANSNPAFNTARAKILNGGGGGNHINGGGGGGANFTGGGLAGSGWNGSANGCPAASAVGGLGGLGLSSEIAASRVFLGGGGGGGQQNNSVGSNGGRGGGLIYIKANELRTSASCSARTISANGATAANAGNDGAGGGGAGGSVVLNIPVYNILGTCPLQIQSNAGNGGSVNSSTHAGGGGGGQGLVVYSIVQPTTNINTTTLNGLGGCNNSGCTSRAGAGVGPNNIGIIENASLPVELVSFEASLLAAEKAILLTWITETETNNEGFYLERSRDGVNFEAIHFAQGAGTTQTVHYYNYKDISALSGLNYYRLKQMDFDGKIAYSKTVAVELPFLSNNIMVYPNPAKDQIQLEWDFEAESVEWTLYTAEGRLVRHAEQNASQGLRVSLGDLPRGLYIMRVTVAEVTKIVKLILE